MISVVAALLMLSGVSAQLETLSAPMAFNAFQRTFHRAYSTPEECVKW